MTCYTGLLSGSKFLKHNNLFHVCSSFRFLPCCVEVLNDAGVIKLAAGTFHSLAQTAYSQVRAAFFYVAKCNLGETC